MSIQIKQERPNTEDTQSATLSAGKYINPEVAIVWLSTLNELDPSLFYDEYFEQPVGCSINLDRDSAIQTLIKYNIDESRAVRIVNALLMIQLGIVKTVIFYLLIDTSATQVSRLGHGFQRKSI